MCKRSGLHLTHSEETDFINGWIMRTVFSGISDNLGENVCVLYICVHKYVCYYLCGCIHVEAIGRCLVFSSVALYISIIINWDKLSCWATLWHWLASKSLESACLWSPMLGWQACTTQLPFTWILGSNLGSSCLGSKHVTPWVISIYLRHVFKSLRLS